MEQKQMKPSDICDSSLEGDILPALADYIGDYLVTDHEHTLRLNRIFERMKAGDYFDTPESAEDLRWLTALLADLTGPPAR